MVLILVCVLFFPVWTGCSYASEKTPSPHKKNSETVNPLENGQRLFLHYCTHCHGNKGEGDGYNAEYLDKEPMNLADSKLMDKKTDEQIFRVIYKGGLGVNKSHLMPVFGHTLSEEEIWSLVAYVRTLSGSGKKVVVSDKIDKHKPEAFKVARKNVEDFSKRFSYSRDKVLIADGEKLFKKKKSCLACHRVNEEGGQVGPDLSRSGSLYTPEWLYVWLMNPHALKPDTKMPNLGLDETESVAIISYLAGLSDADAPEDRGIYLKVKGDPQKGKKLFFDQDGKANCGRCHRIKDEGGKVGPDLSFIGSARTVPFTLESILDPNKVITAGFTTILAMTKDGKFVTGVKKNEDESSLDIIDKEGQEIRLPKEDIKKFKTQTVSMMPGNFVELLSVEEVRDILAFLETQKLPILADMKPTSGIAQVSVAGK